MGRPVGVVGTAIGLVLALAGGSEGVARADEAGPTSSPLVGAAMAPGGAAADAPSVELGRRFIRYEGPRFLSYGLRLYRGDERLRLGFFHGNLPTIVLGSKEGEVHARRARTADILAFSFGVSSLLALGAGVVTTALLDTPADQSLAFTGTLAASLAFVLCGLFARFAERAETARAVNAYNYDLVRGALASP